MGRLAQLSKLTTVQNPEAHATIEIDKYLNELLLLRHLDPLELWEAREPIFPKLYSLMTKLLCVPASSVPCEKLFSKASHLCTQGRSRLTSTKFSKMLFINSNKEYI